jgi:uncharacterized 2Fe-2S/4Fe-4S cluster protein (DUF4445 family)
MDDKEYKVTFEPEGKSVYVPAGTSLYEAAGEAGIILKAECGGGGVCGNCRVVVMKGAYEQKGSERFLTREDIAQGKVLACRAFVRGDLVVEIPLTSRLFEQKILTETVHKELRLSPNIRKVYIQVEEPTLEDQRADLDRVWKVLRETLDGSGSSPRIALDVLRRLPDKLRQGNFGATFVLNGGEIVGIETGDKTALSYGVAFDIGTTTVVGYLHDLNNGKQLAVAARTNPQTSHGDDVISRINYTMTKKEGLDDMHERIASCMNEIIDELAASAGIERKFIYEVTTTGNTTMNHLFLKLNPRNLALNPYVGVLRSSIEERADRLDIHINRYGKVYAMPNIGGFVGGDTVAVILASELHKSEKIKFAIDIGTNGELVLGNRDRLVSCSTAAGPAFEGARITFGMRASDGAIEKVVITDRGVEVNVIGNAKPIGICGTALIDSIGELRKAGVINTNGRMLRREELEALSETSGAPGVSNRESGAPTGVPGTPVPEFILERLVVHEKHGTSFILVHGRETQTGEDILLTQKDVRETQLAKGAIFAGYQILKAVLGVKDEDVTEVLLAGAFGNYIRREQAKRIGLLPDLPTEKIKFIGNAAGTGSKMVLLARELREEACEISRRTEYIELAVRTDFHKIFAESMFFPEC